jgi:hypothetical protein
MKTLLERSYDRDSIIQCTPHFEIEREKSHLDDFFDRALGTIECRLFMLLSDFEVWSHVADQNLIRAKANSTLDSSRTGQHTYNKDPTTSSDPPGDH